MSDKICYIGYRREIPTHVPKNPWIGIGSVGAIIEQDKISVLFDDGSWLVQRIDA